MRDTSARRADKPRAMKIARVDAAAGLMSTVNSRHESITLDIVAQLLLPVLDGTNDMNALRRHLIAAEGRNAVVFQRDGLCIAGEDAVTASVSCSGVFMGKWGLAPRREIRIWRRTR